MAVKKRRWRRSVQAVLGRGEKRKRAGRGAVEDCGFSLYIGVEGLTLMGTKRFMFKWCLHCGMKRGGGGNGRGMWCGAWAVIPWRGKARAALEGGGSQRWRHSPASVWKEEEEAGWAEWAKRPNWPVGLLARLGQKLKKICSE
jgi:hypothetical protein